LFRRVRRYFKRDAAFIEKAPNRRRAGRDPALGHKPFRDLVTRHIGRLFDKAENESFMGIKLRARRLTLLACRGLAMVAITPVPFPCRRDANAEATGRLARRQTCRNHPNDPPAKVAAETV